MSLSWALSETSSIDFKATDTVVLKAIKFSDELINIDDDYEDAEADYKATMLINCQSITGAIFYMFELFGGVSES
jgi:DNA recombination-dependent growth factor C